MTLVCVVMTLLLASTHALTRDRINGLAGQRDREAKQTVFPEAEEFIDVTLPEGAPALSAMEAKDSTGTSLGYVLTTEYRGYGGDVQIMTGFDRDGVIRTVLVTEEEETPGLGTRVRNPGFLAPFLDHPADTVFTVKPDEVQRERVDAIAGATISSNA